MKKSLLPLFLLAALAAVWPLSLTAQTTGWFLPYDAMFMDMHYEGDAIAVGDVSGDGLDDVVVTAHIHASSAINKIFVFVQDGATHKLNFPVAYDINYIYDSTQVLIGDVSGDGFNDVVAIAKNGFAVYTHKGGDPLDPLNPAQFYQTTQSDGTTVFSPSEILLGDFNDDDLLDVAVPNPDSYEDDQILIFQQNAGHTLDGASRYQAGGDLGYMGYMAAVDFDGDGLTDIVYRDPTPSTPATFVVLTQAAGGGFNAPYIKTYAFSDTWQQDVNNLEVGDVTGDGRPDLVIAQGGNKPNAYVSVFANLGGTLADPVTYASYDIPNALAIADITGDGRNDIVVQHHGWGSMGLYVQNNSGTLASEELYRYMENTWNIHTLACGDLNGDGHMDAIQATGEPRSQSLSVFWGTGGTVPPSVNVRSPNGGERLGTGTSWSITWSASSDVDYVKIEYSTSNGTGWTTLTDKVSCSDYQYNSYSWTIPSGQASKLCRVRITKVLADGTVVPGVSDTSLWPFEIYDNSVPSITVTTPNGGESWMATTKHDIVWTSTGAIQYVKIDYSIDGGSSWSSIYDSYNDGVIAWTVPNAPSTTCLVRISDRDGDPVDQSDGYFTIGAYVETLNAPNAPTGPVSGKIAASCGYATGGSLSSFGHDVQYKFDWDDGSDSGWLATGTTAASHGWATAGIYHVRAMARCAEHAAIESPWSDTQTVIIYDDTAVGHYNSPAQYKVLPEVIWASATGGGTWVSEVQLTDVTGGSQVYVCYNTATGRRGPFLLWNNTGGALSSIKYSNLLQTIDGLDSGTFAYYGTVGAVEFITQDGSHLVHAAVRELNGNYAKTSSGLSLHDANTATTARAMIVSNLSSNATYRATVGFFNPTADSLTVEFTLLNGSGAQIGAQFSETFAGHAFLAFGPFTRAGVPYPGSSYDSVILRVRPTSGAGKLMCFGATANNTSNDPAAHVAVQGTTGYDNGPGSLQVLPEVIWASATGGGTWVSEVQLTDVTGGSQVSVYYNTLSGRRGPFLLWNNTGSALSSIKFANLLETIDGLDAGTFTYYGTVGSVEFVTQDGSHLLQAAVRELNGNYAKTFSGLNLVDAETADTTRTMLVQNLTNNASYRSTVGFFNPTADSITVEFTLLDGSGAQIGSQFSETFAGHAFQAFSPFSKAGVPFPGSSYDNVILRVRPTSGAGEVMCFGATANNASNDPAAHLAVQAE